MIFMSNLQKKCPIAIGAMGDPYICDEKSLFY